MFCVCDAIPTAWARTFIENTSAVQIHVVAPPSKSVSACDDKGKMIKPTGRFIKKNEEKEKKNNTDSDRPRFCTAGKRRGLSVDSGDRKHTSSHTEGTNDEEETTPKTVGSPCGIEGEDNTESGVQSVDESNRVGVCEDLLVYNGGVSDQRTLTSNLLSGIEDQSNEKTLANRLVLPKGGVGARDGLGLEVKSLTDLENLKIDLFGGDTDSGKSAASVLLTTAVLHVPTRRFRHECEHTEDEDGSQKLEDDHDPPVPVSCQLSLVLLACVVDPLEC